MGPTPHFSSHTPIPGERSAAVLSESMLTESMLRESMLSESMLNKSMVSDSVMSEFVLSEFMPAGGEVTCTVLKENKNAT